MTIDTMENIEIEKSVPHTMTQLIEYLPGKVTSKIIIKKTTGSVVITSFDTDEAQAESISAFDIYIQVIEGIAGFMINKEPYRLMAGQSIVVPAHARHRIIAVTKFKMLSTLIKSGYEEIA